MMAKEENTKKLNFLHVIVTKLLQHRRFIVEIKINLPVMDFNGSSSVPRESCCSTPCPLSKPSALSGMECCRTGTDRRPLVTPLRTSTSNGIRHLTGRCSRKIWYESCDVYSRDTRIYHSCVVHSKLSTICLSYLAIGLYCPLFIQEVIGPTRIYEWMLVVAEVSHTKLWHVLIVFPAPSA